MAAKDPLGVRWRTSTYSGTGGGQCVQVMRWARAVRVRDSTVPEGTVLRFPAGAWAAFVVAAVGRCL
ncbi:DUF397 domain-containing protein [Streptomonospora sp. PA3]|uniref:DUF397 domain-containing protein n=1 Tax=Streptomonospora sp. PA3 TaxID=2607326 RepID=UPI0012DD2D29|nr:DUF397 domain-containing protein [Streptomonospora sp. PA3]MUL39906.1 DUF397 domain-containing protein [Streptomonospora sp. PA3]